MKIFILFIVAVSFGTVKSWSLTPEAKTTFKAFNEACTKETNVDPKLVQHLAHDDFSNRDDKLNSYVFCIYKKVGSVTDDGVYHKEVVMDSIPAGVDREKVSRAYDACIEKKGANKEETAFMVTECYAKELPERVIIFGQ